MVDLTTVAMSVLHEPREATRVQEKSAFLAHHMVYYMLNDAGIALNGFRDSAHRRPHVLLSEESFKTAVDTLEKTCKYMKRKHSDEISGLVRTLDISDAYLHQNFQKAAKMLMNDDIRWGRVASLFFFTSVLAERLYREGNASKIESLIGWLTVFLNDTVVPWVSQQRGDWVSVTTVLLSISCVVKR